MLIQDQLLDDFVPGPRPPIKQVICPWIPLGNFRTPDPLLCAVRFSNYFRPCKTERYRWVSIENNWGKGWNVTSAGWQVTLCDPIWHVSSVAVRRVANCYIRLLYFTRHISSLI